MLAVINVCRYFRWQLQKWVSIVRHELHIHMTHNSRRLQYIWLPWNTECMCSSTIILKLDSWQLHTIGCYLYHTFLMLSTLHYCLYIIQFIIGGIFIILLVIIITLNKVTLYVCPHSCVLYITYTWNSNSVTCDLFKHFAAFINA